MVVEKDIGKIRILHLQNPNNPNSHVDSWSEGTNIHYSKYSIKETDLRIKTATFSSPDYIDLTTGMYAILISSKYHENFSGIVFILFSLFFSSIKFIFLSLLIKG